MRKLFALAFVAMLGLGMVGCTETTKTKVDDATKATQEAGKAVIEDATKKGKEAVEGAAKEGEKLIEGATDAGKATVENAADAAKDAVGPKKD